jgi:hypothetical protein
VLISAKDDFGKMVSRDNLSLSGFNNLFEYLAVSNVFPLQIFNIRNPEPGKAHETI